MNTQSLLTLLSLAVLISQAGVITTLEADPQTEKFSVEGKSYSVTVSAAQDAPADAPNFDADRATIVTELLLLLVQILTGKSLTIAFHVPNQGYVVVTASQV